MSIDRRQFLTGAATGAAMTLVANTANGATNTRIRVGQIGTKHAHAAGQMSTMRRFRDDFEVVGVVEPDEGRWNRVKSSDAYRGLPRLTEEELFDVKGLQAVAVETEVRDLVPTGLRCAQQNLHVFLDKPPGASYADFKVLVDLLEKKERVLQMGYMLRHNPGFELMFEIVSNGGLGDVFCIHAEMSKRVGDATRTELAEFAGGSMFELGCHVLDPIVALLGAPTNVSSHLLRSRPQDSLADHVVAVLDFDRANAVVRSSVNEPNGEARRQFVVVGQKGAIELRPLEANQVLLTLTESYADYRPGTHRINLSGRGRYDGLWRSMSAAIQSGDGLPYGPAHNLLAHDTLLRACDMRAPAELGTDRAR